MRTLKVIIAVAILLATVVFAIQNAETVDIRFLTWSVSMPRALLVVVLLGGGVILGVIWSSISLLRREDGDGPGDTQRNEPAEAAKPDPS